MCSTIEVIVDPNVEGAVAHYNGVYNRQASTINGYDWWVARNDVFMTDAGTNATLYFSSAHERWVLEAPDVYWEASERPGDQWDTSGLHNCMPITRRFGSRRPV